MSGALYLGNRSCGSLAQGSRLGVRLGSDVCESERPESGSKAPLLPLIKVHYPGLGQ
jgi:hypothetical protein